MTVRCPGRGKNKMYDVLGEVATMVDWHEIIGDRESEFTGKKGELLRYGGVTFVLLVIVQLVKALLSVIGYASGTLDAAFVAISLAMFVVYPLYRKVRPAQVGDAA